MEARQSTLRNTAAKRVAPFAKKACPPKISKAWGFRTNRRTCLQHHTVSIILDYFLIIYYINITYYLRITYYYCTSRTVHMTLAKCSAVKFCAWFLKTWRGALLMRPAHSTQPWHTTMPRFFRWSQVRTLRSDSMPAPLQDVARQGWNCWNHVQFWTAYTCCWTGEKHIASYTHMISTSKDNCVLNVGVFASEQPGLDGSDANIVQEF